MENKIDVLQLLSSRYSTKKFDSSKKIDKSLIKVIKNSLVLSVSSYNTQPWFFYLAEGEEKNKLAQAIVEFNKQKALDSSHLLIMCGKKLNQKHVSDLILNAKGSAEELKCTADNLSRMLEKNEMDKTDVINQVYIALGALSVNLALLEIDSCIMGGFIKAKMDKLLNLDSDMFSVVVCALGYRDVNDSNVPERKIKERLPIDLVVKELP